MTFKIVLFVCTLVLGAKVDGALKSVCYTNGGGVPIKSLNPSFCTHIIHSFLQLDSSGNIQDTGSVTGYLASLVALKATMPNVKIMIAFGGALGVPNSVWSSMVANSKTRGNFATSVLNYLKTNKIDGVDLDWEYPGEASSFDVGNFSLLLKQLRTTVGSSFLISAALGANMWRVGNAYDLPSIFGACDFVNIMSYDMSGWQSDGVIRPVGYHSPLLANPSDGGNNIDSFMTAFLALPGVVSSKIILGIPTYGHVWTLTTSNTAVYALGISNSATEDYNAICQKVKSKQYTSVPDNAQKSVYAFAGNKWVAYESPDSAAFKAQYIKDKSFGGAMFWSLNGDDYSNLCGLGVSPIIAKVYSIIIGGATPTQAPVTQTATQAPVTQTATKAPTTPKSSGGAFVCPGSGLFKNPSDCSSFYNCVNGVAFLQACPTGLRYSTAFSGCDWPTNVVC